MLFRSRNNDKIIIDAKNNKIDLKIDKKEFDKRINSLKLQSNNKYKGVVKKYINSVSSASKGCITD